MRERRDRGRFLEIEAPPQVEHRHEQAAHAADAEHVARGARGTSVIGGGLRISGSA